MNDLFHGFEFIRGYIDDLFILIKGDCKDHLQKLELTLNKLEGKRIKCNIEKSFFVKNEMEYLGFWLICDGVKPTIRKIKSITNMKTHTSQKYSQKFIGVINYHRNISPRQSHVLAPLTILTPIKRIFKWAQVKQDAFDEIKRIVAHDTLLTSRSDLS